MLSSTSGNHRHRRDVPIGVPLDLSTPMDWHELPKYNGIQVSQLIYHRHCCFWGKGALGRKKESIGEVGMTSLHVNYSLAEVNASVFLSLYFNHFQT